MPRRGPRSIRHVITIPTGGIGSIPAGTFDISTYVQTASPIVDKAIFDSDDSPFNTPAQVRTPVGIVETDEITLSCKWASGGHTLAAGGAGTGALTPNVWRPTEIGDLFGDPAFRARPDVVSSTTGRPVGIFDYRQHWASTSAENAAPDGPNRTVSCYLVSDPISGEAKKNQMYELKLAPAGAVSRVHP